MSHNRRLERNALANVLQMIVGSLLLFALYRYINATLGVDLLGVWSVVLATVSATRLADLGLSAGVTRFVARDLARGKPESAVLVIDTVLLTLAVSVGVMLPLIYPLFSMLLPHIFTGNHLFLAQELLPYSLASLWMTVVATVFQGGLNGCHRMELRAGLVVIGQAIFLGLSLLLVPSYKLIGLALAQLGQGLFLAVGGRFLLRIALPQLSLLPRRWYWHSLREMVGYGVNLQVATVCMLLFDSVAKALMARFGGASAAGYFEMANQVALKLRGVIVAANQAIVPHMAELAENAPGQIIRLYHTNIRLLIFITVPIFTLAFAWAGGISSLLAGEFQLKFVYFAGVLFFAWGLNIFASPAYFTNMGVGKVGWNTISHMAIGLINAGLGWILGSRFGAYGVIFAYSVALITGSIVLIISFHWNNHLKWHVWFMYEHFWIITSSFLIVGCSWIYPMRTVSDNIYLFLAEVLVPLVLIGFVAWCHPLRREIFYQFKFWLKET